MSIIEFLIEYKDTIGLIAGILGAIGAIGAIAVGIWAAKRKPDKPESEKIRHKLKIKIRDLGWKIEKISQILGRRQTRAELVDLSGSINDSLEAIRRILALHHQSLIDLKEDINKPMTQEQIETYFISYAKPLRDMIDEAHMKKSKIEGRRWEGIEPRGKDEKIRKRI